MLTPLKINYNIIPEDVIRQYQINKPRIISGHIFESVVAELVTKNTELKETVEQLESELENSYTSEEYEELDNELTKLKTDLATYLANCENLTEIQPYFEEENLEKLIDDYAE